MTVHIKTSLGKLLLVLGLLLVANSAYIAAFPQASVFYMANVLLHLALGLGLMVAAVFAARRYPRESGAFLLSGLPALYLAVRGVAVYSPEGKLLGKIHPPVNPRNIAFGDNDFRTLYMIGNALFRVRMDIAGSVQY